MCVGVGNFATFQRQVVHVGNKSLVHLLYIVQYTYEEEEKNHQRNHRVDVDAFNGGCVTFDVFKHGGKGEW